MGPFPGRPLGAANNPDFQHRVIAAGLDLLNRSNGPVLEDFPEEAPDQDHATAMACPVSFIRPTSETTSWSDRLSHELSSSNPGTTSANGVATGAPLQAYRAHRWMRSLNDWPNT